MSKHAPGPWKADLIRDCIADTGDYYSYWNIKAENKGSVCQIHDSGHDEIDDANARLIAAAPDLYETLCSMIHVLTEIATATKLDLEKTVIKAKDQATGKEASVSAMTVFIDALSVISKVSGETNE